MWWQGIFNNQKMEAETERYMSDINNSVYDSIYKRRSIRKYKSDMHPKRAD